MTTPDDRAEQAFRTALGERATAYEPAPLTPATTRRPRWVPVLAAAAAVVIVAAGLTWAFRGTSTTPPPPADGTGSASLPEGWRWESHRDAIVGVPDSWGYAAAPRSDWCAQTEIHNQNLDLTPFVDVGRGLVLTIGCAATPPASLFRTHLSFSDTGKTEELPPPAGWQTLTRDVGHTRIQVVTDARHLDLARRVLSTAHEVSADQNGCPTTSPLQRTGFPRPEPAFDVTQLKTVESIAVCQYARTGATGPGLDASRLVTGQAALALLEAIRSAPTGGGPDRPRNCLPSDPGASAIELMLRTPAGSHPVYAYYGSCHHNGLDDGVRMRTLTAQSCRPLFGERVTLTEASSGVFRVCRPTRF